MMSPREGNSGEGVEWWYGNYTESFGVLGSAVCWVLREALVGRSEDDKSHDYLMLTLMIVPRSRND